MDCIDLCILEALRKNARTPASAIAKLANLSVPAILERIKKLSSSGVIERFTIQLNRRRMGETLLAFVFVRLESAADTMFFREKTIAFPCVLECHHIAGDYDYLLKVSVADTSLLEEFLSMQLKQIPGVLATNTLIVLTTLKEEFNVTL